LRKQEIFKAIRNACNVGIKENETYKKKHDDYYSGQITAYRNILGTINIIAIGEDD